jgi:hypothetical protein
MADWLGLGRVVVSRKGNFAKQLRSGFRQLGDASG